MDEKKEIFIDGDEQFTEETVGELTDGKGDDE